MRKRLRGARYPWVSPRFARGAWTIFDQVISSAVNFGVGVAAAHIGSLKEFGAFAIGFVLLQFGVSLVRAMFGDALLIRQSTADWESWYHGFISTMVRVAAGGLAAGAAMAIAGVVWGGDIRGVLLPLGLTLAGFLCQDVVRFAFFAKGEPQKSVANEAVWATLAGVGLLACWVTDSLSITALIYVWGGASIIASFVGLAQGRAVVGPRPLSTAGPSEGAVDIGLSMRLGAEYIAAFGGVQASLIALTAFVGLEGAGTLRGVIVIFGPVMVAFQAFHAYVIPDWARRIASSLGPPTIQNVIALAGVLAALTIAWVSVVLSFGDRFGPALLDDVWPSARAIAGIWSIFVVGEAAIVSARAVLRARDRTGQSLAMRVILAPVQFSAALVGGALGGVTGATWGLAGANLFAGAVWMAGLSRMESKTGRLSSAPLKMPNVQ